MLSGIASNAIFTVPLERTRLLTVSKNMIATQALQARAAVLSLLSSSTDEARISWRNLAPSSPQVWDFVLRAERCALAVRAKLGEYNLAQDTAPDVVTLIGARATLELQRALSARAQLHRIAEIAGEYDWKVIVMKGGAMLTSGGQIDLHDIDVLIRANAAPALARLLDEEGYSSPRSDEGNMHHHLSPRRQENAVAIEIHRTIKGLDDPQDLLNHAVRTKTNTGLWQFAPIDHLWHLLIHSTIQHPDRRGCIRDIVLIAHGINACTSNDIRTIIARIATHKDAHVLHAAFSLAQSVTEQRPIPDPFIDVTLRKYILFARYGGRGSNLRKRTLRFVCGDRSIIRALKEDLEMPTRGPSEFGALNRLDSKVAWIAPMMRQLLRVGRLSIVAGLATQNAWETSRVKHKLLRGKPTM